MLRRIFLNRYNRLRLILKYPLIMLLSYFFYFSIFGYVSIYGMQLFFEAKTGNHFGFDYMLDSLYEIGLMDIQFEVAFILIIMLFAKYIDKFRLSELGLKGGMGAVRRFFVGAAAAAFFMLIPYVACLVIGSVRLEGFYWQVNPSDNGLGIAIVYDCILLLLVGFQEELLNRAYLIKNLGGWKPWKAILLSSLIFSALHLMNPGIDFINAFQTSALGLLNIFIIGWIYGLYYYHTSDLWLITGAHFSWNFMQGSVMGLPISGDVSKGILVSTVNGSKLLTGGQFGPEGGLLVTGSLILMLVATKVYLGRGNMAQRSA